MLTGTPSSTKALILLDTSETSFEDGCGERRGFALGYVSNRSTMVTVLGLLRLLLSDWKILSRVT